MKNLYALFAGLGVLGIAAWFFLAFGFMGLILYATIYGVYMAFSASVLLGIVVLLVEPSSAVIGLVMLFFHKNLAQALIEFLTK